MEELKNFSIEINENRIDFRVTDDQFTCLANDDEYLLEYITEAIEKGKIPNVRSIDDITIKRLNHRQIEGDTSERASGNENSLEEMLITLVSQNPPLYDCTLPLKNRSLNIRNDIWSSLVELLQEAGFSVNVEAVKNKWKYLRDHFLKLRAIVEKHVPTGSAASCIVKRDIEKAKAWKYFNSMQFLKDSSEKRATTSSLNIAPTVDKENTVEEIDRATSSSKRRKKEDEAFLNKLQEITNVPLPEIPKMDEVDNFCQHLAAGLRRLPIQSRYKVEIEFLRILGDAHVLNDV
ncbi:unnamed protein product [Phaedon cochleariae]|uniref:MADF domain-containing protein n=1 Tax=Phaedon cochleariae TaxID=80249 RepID=A0A9P0DMH8_PHACE|nr:unnamed protein product [Phaedon cochleariae]